MNSTYTAVIKPDAVWWIGLIEEMPGVNCQEKTREELMDSLSVTLREALEHNRREALDAAGTGYEEIPIAAAASSVRNFCRDLGLPHVK